jgi:hypothetical protein
MATKTNHTVKIPSDHGAVLTRAQSTFVFELEVVKRGGQPLRAMYELQLEGAARQRL